MKRMSIFLNLIFFIQMLTSCHQKPEGETYLIPEGFKGRATVIFNQKEGVPSKYENGRRIYEIPSNGILLTQFKDEYGIVDHKYYYVNSSGKKTSLQIYKYEYNKDGTTKWLIKNENEAGVFLDGTTGQYAKESEAPFQLFIISSNNELDSFYTKEYQKNFNEKINKLIGSNL